MQRFSWLAAFSKPYFISGNNVEVIYSPDKFYDALQTGIRGAQRRIVMSSLYLGTDKLEAQLVEGLRSSMADVSRPELRTTILLDHLRGFRGSPNSCTLLKDLIDDKFSAYFYHTPNLRGLLRRVAPSRFNEVMGLQHMKIYLFDDSFIISGANLSRDYFTNRQDRYMKFSNCPQLADFMATLVETVASFSFKARANGSTESPVAAKNPLTSKHASKAFRNTFRNVMARFTSPSDSPSVEGALSVQEGQSGDHFDTVVYPLLQMGQYDISQDAIVTRKILAQLRKEEKLFLTSGYFNLPPQYIQAILSSKGQCSVLGASPQANGFYGAKGVAKHVPSMYIHFAQEFLESIIKHGCEDRVKYSEYFRNGWTFHGKGLWYYLGNDNLPSLTLVGSSNYGHRSLTRDLEVQLAVVTENGSLRHALHKEQEALFQCGKELHLDSVRQDPSRQLNSLQWMATQLLRPHV